MSKDFSNLPVQPESKESSISTVGWGPWQGLGFGLLAYIISIFASTYFVQYAFPKSLSDLDITIATYTISSLLLVGCVLGFLKLKNFSLHRFMGKFNPKELLYVPLFYIGYFVVTYIVQALLGLIQGYNAGQSQSFGLDNASGLSLVGVLIVLVLLPPIAEEMVFRGIIFRGMRRKWGRVVAAIVTSLLFGAAHGQWNVAADTFVLSLFLIAALETTESLYVPMALHMLKNFIAYLLVFVLLK